MYYWAQATGIQSSVEMGMPSGSEPARTMEEKGEEEEEEDEEEDDDERVMRAELLRAMLTKRAAKAKTTLVSILWICLQDFLYSLSYPAKSGPRLIRIRDLARYGRLNVYNM